MMMKVTEAMEVVVMMGMRAMVMEVMIVVPMVAMVGGESCCDTRKPLDEAHDKARLTSRPPPVSESASWSLGQQGCWSLGLIPPV